MMGHAVISYLAGLREMVSVAASAPQKKKKKEEEKFINHNNAIYTS